MKDYIYILTVSPEYYLIMVVYCALKMGDNKNSPYSLNVMVNYHYHCENRVINR